MGNDAGGAGRLPLRACVREHHQQHRREAAPRRATPRHSAPLRVTRRHTAPRRHALGRTLRPAGTSQLSYLRTPVPYLPNQHYIDKENVVAFRTPLRMIF